MKTFFTKLVSNQYPFEVELACAIGILCVFFGAFVGLVALTVKVFNIP